VGVFLRKRRQGEVRRVVPPGEKLGVVASLERVATGPKEGSFFTPMRTSLPMAWVKGTNSARRKPSIAGFLPGGGRMAGGDFFPHGRHHEAHVQGVVGGDLAHPSELGLVGDIRRNDLQDALPRRAPAGRRRPRRVGHEHVPRSPQPQSLQNPVDLSLVEAAPPFRGGLLENRVDRSIVLASKSIGLSSSS
jgi:hypothetical protein